MYMNMYMIIHMNIYIKEENEYNLRRYDGSMSGLVNRLLEDFFKEYPAAATGAEKPKKYAKHPGKYPTDGTKPINAPAQETVKFCKHQQVKGLCKKGCR